MNKKFSTLAVAAMLASAFTAYAGPGHVVTKLAEGNNGKAYQLVTKNGTTEMYLALDANDGVKLVSEFDTKGNANPSYTRGGALWCVNVTKENNGKTIIYDFTNKAHGDILDLTVGGYETWTPDDNGVRTKELTRVGGEVSGWAFAPVLGDDDNKMFGSDKVADAKPYPLYSYINSNEVATLVWNEDKSKILVAVVRADNLDAVKDSQIEFFLKEADPVNLTAAEFNTVLFTQKEAFRSLEFVKDANNTDIVNPFSTNELKASEAHEGFVNLYKMNADGTKSYLRVDTAYANGYGTKFLTFAFSKGDEKIAESPISKQYNFLLNYCLTEDSLSIQVEEALYKVNDFTSSDENHKWWSDYNKDEESSEFYVRTWKDVLDYDGSYLGEAGSEAVKDKKANTNWVKLQDLEAATESRIVTVGQSPINTHISFGFGDCTAVQAEYTSVEDGVYFIKNAKGQYLTYPIYIGAEDGANTKPQFVTVNASEQEVAHMPAFQWVVLKEYTETEGTKKFSPVKLANREFNENFDYRGLQLKQAAGAKYMYASGNVIENTSANDPKDYWTVTVDSLQFEAVPAASINDPYMGYKKFTKDELTTGGKYTFNYWHPYAQDKYIGQADKDSTFTVWDQIAKFDIDTVAYNPVKHTAYVVANNATTLTENDNVIDVPTVDIAYGFDPENALDANDKERISGLAHLVRTAYKISLNGSALKVNQNDQFNTGKNSWAYGKANEGEGVQKFDEYIAFFKENMDVNGKCYYAILKAENNLSPSLVKALNDKGKDLGYSIYSPVYSTKNIDGVDYLVNKEFVVAGYKAGVSDYDAAATLKNQVIVETRTSSFAIERDETPLYRRFNSAALEGQAGDDQDTLRFYEKYRNEYLMIEANPSFMVEHIDFLGIDAQDKAKGGLAFIVDTAWVNRGAGNIKPQYLISIDRHDFAGTEGVPCTYEHNHYDNQGNAVDAAHCSHAIPATPKFARGKYLINFHDFANANDFVGKDKYKWAEYDRAGFKEAIVVGDTLYILRDEFKNLPNEEIDLAKLASAEVEALRAWTSAKPNVNTDKNFLSYRYELAGDNHKYVTWSMRFYNPSVAANEVEADRAFLFESMKSLATSATNKDDANYVHGEKDVHDGIYGINSAEGDIAPAQAAWLKMQNGCLVLSDENSKFNEVTTGADDALIFNVEHVDGDQVAVDNENIAVEGVSVVAGNGQVTIMGAAGKNVTITNILGKVIANQTIASDNATIAVPAGIVAVAVEGEAAVKAIVK